jgi:putative hydrolase
MAVEPNDAIADQFDEAAALLENQGASSYRVRAYRRAAGALRQMDESVDEIYRHRGIDGLVAIPTIGDSLARAIVDVIEHGTWRWIHRLRGEADPEALFATVAGIGPVLAQRIHHDLGIERLEDLECAAHDGRLDTVPGFGNARVRAVREALAGRLQTRRTARPAARTGRVPELLDIDAEYRRRAAAGELPLIAPRRFNPTGEAWLPVLHTERSGRHYTALFSNTARAHRLGTTGDWVVVYADEPDDGQWTVVTETTGRRTGDRVVRGLEHLTPEAVDRSGQGATAFVVE